MKKLQVCVYYEKSTLVAHMMAADTRQEAVDLIEKEIGVPISLVDMKHVIVPAGSSIAVKNDGGVYVTLRETKK